MIIGLFASVINGAAYPILTLLFGSMVKILILKNFINFYYILEESQFL